MRNRFLTDTTAQTITVFFAARWYAERGIATASCLSVRPSVRLRYRDNIGLEKFEDNFTVR